MSRTRIIFWAIALFLLAATVVMQVKSGNAGDKNWLLLASREWLSGRKIGVDIFEVNPPLIIWLYSIPVWLSQHVHGLPDFYALIYIGLALTALSTLLGVRLIALHPAFAGNRSAQADFALLMLAALLFFDTPVYFFDRDHIMFVLIFPYMLRYMPALALRLPPMGLRLPVALMAALGFCMKPQTLVVFAVLQLLFIVRERSFRILWAFENLIIYAGWAIYALCVWSFAHDYLAVVVPIAMETYSGFSRKINGYLYLALAFISLGLTFVDFRPRFKTPYRAEAYYFMGVSAAFLCYALLNNGWGYTWNLLICMSLFLSGWMLWDYSWLKREHERQGLPARQFVFGRRSCAINLGLNAAYMIACLVTFFFTGACDKYADCRKREVFVSYVKDNHIHSFSTMSMELRRWASLVRYTHAQWDSRFNHLWMLPTLLNENEAQALRHTWIADYIGNAYAQDLERWKPEIVFVDISDGMFGYQHPVDIPAFLGRTPAFREAWAHYKIRTVIDTCEDFDDEPGKDNKKAPSARPKGNDCRYAIYGRLP